MDTTIRNLDEKTYRELKARAALSGRTIGELINEAARAYLAMPHQLDREGSLTELLPERYPDGCEQLSEEIDTIVYGA